MSHRPEITWFANSHDHSVHYIKLGLMRLHRAGEIVFRERPNATAGDLLPAPVRAHPHRRTAVLRVRDGARARLIVLDGEDSIFQTSPLIQWCDLYFSCTYRSRFFSGDSFDLELPWQTDGELDHYQREYGRLQQAFAPHLHKGRPLVPIGPDLDAALPMTWVGARWRGVKHRLSKLRAPWIDWSAQHERFEHRWARLLALRTSEPDVDVVLKDSLWGWPRHRRALHERLSALADRFTIHSELHYREPFAYELGGMPAPNADDYPIRAGGGVPGAYESMLARSRVGVFATGFHFGCRSIVMFAWMQGLRVLSDPFSFESMIDLRELGTRFNDDGDWKSLENLLDETRNERSAERVARQQAFDRLLDPSRCARQLLETTLGA